MTGAQNRVGRAAVVGIFGMVAGAFLLWLTLRGLDLAEVRTAIREARLWLLAPAIATYFASLGMRAWRWSVLLRPIRRIGWVHLFAAVAVGTMGNMLLPARAGDLLRAAVLGGRLGGTLTPAPSAQPHGPTREEGGQTGTAAVLGSVTCEAVLDGLIIVGIVLAMSRFLPWPTWLALGVPAVAVLFITALITLIGMLAFRPKLIALLQRLLGQFAWAGRPLGWADHFMGGLAALREPRLLAQAALISLLAWGMSGLECYWIMMAFDLPLGGGTVGGIGAGLFVVAAIGLSMLIPAMPGYVGAFEFAGTAILGGLAIPAADAFSSTVLLHLVEIVPVTIVGSIILCRLRGPESSPR